MSWFNKLLSKGAYNLGGFIALYPKHILVAFAALSLALTTGVLQFVYINDVEYLFTVTDGPTKIGRAVVEHFFQPNTSRRFDPSRITRLGRFARILIMERNENNLLRGDIWKEIEDLDREIRNVTIEWEDEEYNYSDMCAKWLDDCYMNEFLEIGDVIADFEKGNARISYPVFFHLKTYKAHPLAQYFGGVNTSTDGFTLHGVKAIMLNYFIADNDDDIGNERGRKWEDAIIDLAQKKDKSSKSLKLYYFALHTLSTEIEENIKSALLPLLIAPFIVGIYIIFSTTSTSDWVKSKPLLALMGGVSGALGVLASIGILCYFEVPIIGLSISIPFLMLAIGIDDTFVMLSVWKTTSPLDPVPKRMAECYAEAVVSVCITSLTDMFSFYVGVLTPIPCIQIFSLYAGTGVLCIFVWQIFFFGSCLAISGYYEEENKHSVFWCIQATPRSKSGKMSLLSRFFLSGGIDKMDPYNPLDHYVDTTTTFFRDTFAPVLCKTWVKVCVLITFAAYLVVSYYGLTYLQEGLELQRLVRYDSYMADFMDIDDKYFKIYPYRIQVVISKPLDYSLQSNKKKIKNLMDRLAENEHVTFDFQENWLNSFTTYVSNYQEILDLNISTEANFIKTLKEDYLQDTSRLSDDIIFNEDNTKIIASRFIIQIKNLFTLNMATQFTKNIRNAVDDPAFEDLGVVLYNPWWHYADQFLLIRELTVKLLVVAIIIVMIVTVILIPSFICCLCVLLTIFSIEFGVIGFMALWGVNLDIVSVTCIVMCVGFSVDFSAHISYAFVSSQADSPDEKLKDCLFSLGKPVIQGALSTFIAVSPLVFIPSYIFHSDCKIILLIIGFASAHALVLLPVMLSILKPGRGFMIPWKQSKTYSVTLEKSVDIIKDDKHQYSKKLSIAN